MHIMIAHISTLSTTQKQLSSLEHLIVEPILLILLSNLLTISFSKKIFVDQLRSNSEIIQEINDTFRHRSESLELISYYESKGIHAVGVYSNIFTF